MIDAFSRKVVGWQLASHMRTDLVLDALRMALGQCEPGADFALVAPWFNNDRLHESLGDVSSVEFEDLYVAQRVQLSNLS